MILPGKVIQDLNVSRETHERLEVFANLVRKWNQKINLVSRNSLNDLWNRHIVDSIQVFRCAKDWETWVDMGSGGGFPGLIVGILALDENPNGQVALIESDQRKSAFLRTAARECGVTCQVLTDRIERVDARQSDVVSARALASLNTLLGYAQHHLRPQGIALFPKGITWQKEIEEARLEWQFNVEAITSLTEPGAAILKINGVSRV
jgi:16S rRNA (guanine527-N7)-methyltransferase